jgi:predicted small metal-binding protein
MFADKVLHCDCGYKVREFDEDALVEAIRRHAWEAHGIDFSVELALDLARNARLAPSEREELELSRTEQSERRRNEHSQARTREIVFSSNRAGGLGGQDIWSATRASVDDPWSNPVNLGPNVNTGLGESRPSLSWDAQQLLFGRAGPAGTGEGATGMSDIYVTTREKTGD